MSRVEIKGVARSGRKFVVSRAAHSSMYHPRCDLVTSPPVIARASFTDAELPAGEFSPEFSEADLVSLPNYHVYMKLMVDGSVSRPFSGETFALERPLAD